MRNARPVRIVSNELTASSALESEPCAQLNLTTSTDGSEYPADVVGEITRCILEDSVSVPSQGKRSLRVARDCEIWMIEQGVGFRSKRKFHSFHQLGRFCSSSLFAWKKEQIVHQSEV